MSSIPNPIVVPMTVAVNDVTLPMSVSTDYRLPISLQTLEAGANGEYTAPKGAAWNEARIDVPNSYTAADEGKVVSGGALVTQTGRTVTDNHTTYDTTTNDSVTVEVAGPSGSVTLTKNKSTYDVEQYAEAVVDVDPDEWVRPSDWPDLDSLEIPEDYDCVYLTCDLREAYTKILKYTVRTDEIGGTVYAERGTVVDGDFIVHETKTFQVGILTINLSEEYGNVQLWRIRSPQNHFFSSFIPESIYNVSALNYFLQPPVEMRAIFHTIDQIDFYNRGLLGAFIKSARLYFGADFKMNYLTNNALKIERLVIEGPGKPTKIGYAFSCVSSKSVFNTISGLDLSAVDYARGAFVDSVAETLDLSKTGINTQDPETQNYFLYNAANFHNYNLANTDFGVNMYRNTANMYEFTPGKMYATNVDISAATRISPASLLRIIAAIPQTEETVTLKIGSINQAKLTAEEIAVATEKGWTVA